MTNERHTCTLSVKKRNVYGNTVSKYSACGRPAYGQAMFTASSGLQWLCPSHGGPKKREVQTLANRGHGQIRGNS